MKHNWEYKRLGDICTVIGGSTPKTDVSEYWNGLLNWFTPAEISDKKYYSDSERKITPEAVKAAGLTLMPAGTVLLTSRAPIGKVGITTIESYCNQGFKNFVCGDSILNEYLYYALIHFNDDIKGMGHGATFKEISKKTTENIEIPVPPMAVQQRIVEELDKINEVIDDCRELLHNLDALAQSLFYDTFGDPITNPKGFKFDKLGLRNEISSAKRVLVQDVVDSGIPFIRGTELALLSKQNSFDSSVFTMFITPEHYEKVKAITGVPKLNDLLIPSINPDGYVWEVNTPDPLYFKDGRVLWIHVNHDVYSSKWLKFALSKVIIEKFANLRGAVFAELTLVFLRNLELIVPPIELQENFAKRIEQIEAQKKAVEQTIAELQTLLDSRMDYWFN